MSYFMQHGDDFMPTAGKESILETLPVGNYVATIIRASDVKKLDATKGVYDFTTTEGHRVVFTKKPTQQNTLKEMIY